MCALIAAASAWLWPMLLGTPAVGFAYFAPTLAWVFASVAVPTLLVWRLGRKHVEPGHCRCGYDLTGNVSGKCPECGRRVKTQTYVVARRLNVTTNDANALTTSPRSAGPPTAARAVERARKGVRLIKKE